jgi:hypothetical protein
MANAHEKAHRMEMDRFNDLMRQGFMKAAYSTPARKAAPKCIVCGKKAGKRSSTCSFECAVKVD